MGKYFLIFLLITLLVIEEVNGGWVRKAWKKVKKAGKKIEKHIKKGKETIEKAAKTIATVKTVTGILSTVGKRSTDAELQKIDLCHFESVDFDGDQVITEDEVQTLIDMTGITELNDLFELLDLDNDGKISKDDYSEVVNHCVEEKLEELSKRLTA